jgi:hypothetical protein
MQIELPDHDQQATGYRGLFIIGWRQTDAKLAERTGTVILKRTYDIDPKNGTLLPSTKPWPVFLSDQPDNLVSGCGLVKGYNSPVQAIDFGEPLVNQEFVLSCLAWTDAAKASTSGMRVEADGAILKIVEEPGRPWNVKQKRKSFSWAGKWEQSDQKNNPTIMKLFLPSGTVDGHNVFYEDIKVFNAFRYEHDLASYKPEADVIVLGCANIPHGSRAEIAVGDQIWFARTVEATNRRHLFGWMPRDKESRKTQAGVVPENADAYPLAGLPKDFDNRYFNGYQRDYKLLRGVLPYLKADSEITIRIYPPSPLDPAPTYRFRLRGETVLAECYFQDPTKPDDLPSQPITMNIDTLVVEPKENRCGVVWRGVWAFDSHSEGDYQRLLVTAST